MRSALVISCEHGGYRIPARYRRVLAGAAPSLRTHRGWDPGALPLARELARRFEAPLVACTTTRLLVDTNRSSAHPQVFSAWTRGLSRVERDDILSRCWRPHRAAVEELVRTRAGVRRPALHLSIHSFTPRWKGRLRAVDVGLLYDPARQGERAFAAEWLRALRALRAELRLRRNQPYRGNADGLTSALRERFDGRRYLGIEIEVSQRLVLGPPAAWRSLRRDLCRSLEDALRPEIVRRLLGDAR